jgi:hypothetical protein
VNPADLARYIATILFGMAVQAAGGANRILNQLQALAMNEGYRWKKNYPADKEE